MKNCELCEWENKSRKQFPCNACIRNDLAGEKDAYVKRG